MDNNIVMANIVKLYRLYYIIICDDMYSTNFDCILMAVKIVFERRDNRSMKRINSYL